MREGPVADNATQHTSVGGTGAVSGNPLRNAIDTNVDSAEAIERDIAAVGRISAVPALLNLLCDHTGMGFAAVARVTDGTWTACAVQDRIQFGLLPGGRLDVTSTLCREAREAREPIVVDQFSLDPTYREHHTPRIYGIESYVSVPIILKGDVYFGNLCAIDPRPARVSDAGTRAMFEAYAGLIARQLEDEQLAEASEAALVQAREQARLREEFIAVLGHDLRNPLGAIVGMSDVLTLRTSEPKAAELGVRIKRSARRMSNLIDDVLDLARGRLGSGMGLQAAWVRDLGDALSHVVSELREAHPSRTIVDRIDIPDAVRCDRGRIQQLLSNLLGNALTHGAIESPVTVVVSQDNDTLELSVTNGGEPLSAETLAHMFEPYWRAPVGHADGGLGLGLHICAQIVLAHGGTIDVESTVETGTRFRARLPIGGPTPT